LTLQGLNISQNKRFLTYEDGKPFFWLGDTAWELFHKLNREEVDEYLCQRANLKYNVIQAVALAELDGLAVDNAYGRKPLKMNTEGEYDPQLPDTDGTNHYWDHVDYVIERAESLGIYIALLPTWGDKFNLKHGTGPVIFNESNALAYGQWLGSRYKNQSNIIWVLGGDRPLSTYEHFAIIRTMAAGLKLGDGGRHLMTFHPQGWQSSSYHLHNEAWLDFNMIQSGHGQQQILNYTKLNEDYNLQPIKPVLDAEPCYEDIPVSFKPENGYFDEADVRMAAYYAVFSGAFGHTYGHHCIWSMSKEPNDNYIMHWRDALSRPGAVQMQYVRNLMESRPFTDRVPDQSIIANNRPGANYMVATRGTSYAMIYIPNGVPVNVVMGSIVGVKVKASWYAPHSGQYIDVGIFLNMGTHSFQPPSSGRGNDWVLVLDSVTSSS